MIKYSFLIFYGILSFVGHTSLLPHEIKQTHDIIKEEFRELSPLLGIVWYKGGILENLAEISNIKNPNIKLINNLFYRDNPESFRETRDDKNISTYLTPDKIGQIVGKLYQFQIFLQKEPSIHNSMKSKNSNSLAKDGHIKKITLELRDIMQADLSLDIIDKTTKTLNAYPFLLITSLLASDKNISVYKVLLSLLYFKSRNKEELHGYYQGLFKILGGNIFADEGRFLNEDKISWIKSVFSENEDVPYSAAINDFSYENRVYFFLKKQERTWISSYFTNYETAYPKDALGYGFPDCAENSLLNFYRLILGKKDESLDLELLTQLNTPNELMAYFHKHDNLTKLSSKEARNDWAQLLSNRSSLAHQNIYVNREHYQQKVRPKDYMCEINFGFNRINQALMNIQGLDFDNFITTLNQLRAKNYEIKISKKLDSDGLGEIKFSIPARGDFQWIFQSSHFIFQVDHSKLSLIQGMEQYLFLNGYEHDLIAFFPPSDEKYQLLRDKTIRPEYSILLNILHQEDIISFIAYYLGKKLYNEIALFAKLPDEDAKIRLRDKVLSYSDNDTILYYITWLEKSDETNILSIYGHGENLFHKVLYNHNVLNFAIIAEHLIKYVNKESINSKTRYNETALHFAVEKRCVDMVKILIDHMNVDTIHYKNSSQKTAFEIAIDSKNEKIIEIFLSSSKLNLYDIDIFISAIKICDMDLIKKLSSLINYDIDKLVNKNGENILFNSSVYNNEEIAKFFLCYINPGATNNLGNTPLQELFRYGGNKNIVKFLLSYMTKDDINNINKYGETVLNYVVKNEDYESLMFLLDYIDENHIFIKNSDGNNILHIISGQHYNSVPDYKGTRKNIKLLLINKACKLSNELLRGFYFSDLDLSSIDLSGQNLDNAYFSNVDLSKSNISIEQLKNARICSGVILPLDLDILLRFHKTDCIVM